MGQHVNGNQYSPCLIDYLTGFIILLSPCENLEETCGTEGGISESLCPTPSQIPPIIPPFICQEMCGPCQFISPDDTNLCCDGKLCYNEGYLNTTSCQASEPFQLYSLLL